MNVDNFGTAKLARPALPRGAPVAPAALKFSGIDIENIALLEGARGEYEEVRFSKSIGAPRALTQPYPASIIVRSLKPRSSRLSRLRSPRTAPAWIAVFVSRKWASNLGAVHA